MRIDEIKRWTMIGAVTLATGCRQTTLDETVTETDPGPENIPTEATASGSSGTSGPTDETTVGSMSDSQTMGSTPTSTDTTDGANTGTTGHATNTDTDPSTDTAPQGTSTDTTDAGTSTTDASTGTTDTSTGTTGGMLGPCGEDKQWTLDADFDQGSLDNVDHAAPNGDQLQITIGGISTPEAYMFIAEPTYSMVLKLDTITGKQLARYASVRLVDCAACKMAGSQSPSRLVVDFEGDVYVANQAYSYQGTISKIAGSASACIDRNNNGVIDTSHDVDNDGIIDPDSPAEFLGQDDECLLYSLPVGGLGAIPRAITLDGQGHAYVGTFKENKVYKYDILQSPPALLKTYDVPSSPAGFALRGKYLYSTAFGLPVMRIDVTDGSAKTMNAPDNDGVAVDQNGIAYFGGNGLLRCDFEVGGDCESKGGGFLNGVAIDGAGQVWAANQTTGAVAKFDGAGNLLGSVNAYGAHGVAIGHDGDIRVIGDYDAFRVAAGAKGGPPGAVTKYYTGFLNNIKPTNFTYSDFTGFATQNITVKKGEWTVIHDGGEDDANWDQVLYNLEPEGEIPVDTSLTFQLRAANVQAKLAATPWVDVDGNAPAQPVVGRFYELRARLLIVDPALEQSAVLSDVCVTRKP